MTVPTGQYLVFCLPVPIVTLHVILISSPLLSLKDGLSFLSNELKNLLIKQIESRVRWRERVINMIKNNVNHFIEIGPGKVLSGLVKRIDRVVKINTINQEEDIKNLKNEYFKK